MLHSTGCAKQTQHAKLGGSGGMLTQETFLKVNALKWHLEAILHAKSFQHQW